MRQKNIYMPHKIGSTHIRKMDKETFGKYLTDHSALIKEIEESACKLHDSVGQTYDQTKPYGFHLRMTASAALRFGHEVVVQEKDIIPVIFGAYYHDSIEDARLTYNDVTKTAKRFMSDEQAFTAAEIVYALTNDKGRTRGERAGEHYYAGIRSTVYAPFIKLCDRYANMSYSFKGTNTDNRHMREVYIKEWAHFISSITADSNDLKLSLPHTMIEEIEFLINGTL